MDYRPNSLVPKHPRSVLGAAGLRRDDWARLSAATSPIIRPPGPRAKARSTAPARFIARTTFPANEKKNLAIPPQLHVRKKLEPTGAAVFELNG